MPEYSTQDFIKIITNEANLEGRSRYAKRIGFSRQFLNDVLGYRRDITKRFLEEVGWERKVEFDGSEVYRRKSE